MGSREAEIFWKRVGNYFNIRGEKTRGVIIFCILGLLNEALAGQYSNNDPNWGFSELSVPNKHTCYSFLEMANSS